MTETELKLSAAAIIVGLQDAQKRLENTRSNRHAKQEAEGCCSRRIEHSQIVGPAAFRASQSLA